MCVINDESNCQLFSVKYPVGRSQRRCDTCNTVLPVGKRYMRASWLVDGSWSSEVSCIPCARIAERFGVEHKFTPAPTYLVECLRSCIDEGDVETQWSNALEEIRQRITLSRLTSEVAP